MKRLALLLCVALSGCVPKAKPGASPGADNSPEAKACPADGVVDDGEDNDNHVIVQKGRSGYWYAFADKAGSVISPTAGDQGGTFTMSPGGAQSSAYAARMNGKVGTGNVVFAGIGINFTDPKGPYDASAYKGIAFWAKKGPGTGRVRLKVPDASTDPDGKVCSECFNDFGADLELTEQWAKYTVPFGSMHQMPGWGSPHPAAIDPSKIYGVQFQVNTPGTGYDISVDDLQFTGCP
jgi:endoglucanase